MPDDLGVLIVKSCLPMHNALHMHTSSSKLHGDRFDWNLVPTFLAALDHGSLMAAARALGISQPTAGRHINELEAQIGAVLFERTGRGLNPTAVGLQLAQAARSMEDGAHALIRRVQGQQPALEGSVRLSASQPVACVLLPPVLASMRQALPDIQVELVVTNTVSNLLLREADIALRMVRPAQGSLVMQRIAQVSLSACAQRSYLSRFGTPAEPADLLRHDMVGNDRIDDITRGFAARGLPLPTERMVLRTDDLMAYWAAVRAGLGVGFLGDYLIRADPDTVPLLPQLKIPPLPIWLTVHREIRTSARIRAVYDFLAAELPKLL